MSTLIQKLNTSTGKWEASELIEDDLPDNIGGGSQLDIAEKTLYVSPTFTTEGQFYDNIEDAITDADTDGNAHVIEIWGGHSGNYDFGIHTAYLHPLAHITPYNTAFPAVYLGGGDLLGDGIVSDGGVTGTSYLVEVSEDARIEAKEIYADYGAINLSGFTGGQGRYIDINVDTLGEVNYDSAIAPVYVKIKTGFLNGIEADGHSEATFNINANEFLGKAVLNSGKVYLDVQHYLTEDTRVIEVSGASAIVKGRIEDYDDTTNTATGLGFPVIIGSGSLRLQDFQAKNASGGVVFGIGGTFLMNNSVLESGAVGGGSGDPTIDSAAPFDVVYTTRNGLNNAVGTFVNETATGNRATNSGITI